MAVSKISMRQLTTRVPLMFVLMESLHQCDVRQVRFPGSSYRKGSWSPCFSSQTLVIRFRP